MEQNREARSKPIHLWPIDFLTKMSSPFNGERIVSLTNGTGKTGYPHAK